MAVVVRVDALRSVAYTSISASYTTLGTSFTHPMRLIHITNNTDGDMIISFDGTIDNLFVPANSFALYDLTTNREENDTNFVFQKGTQPFVRYSTAPTMGAVYLSCFFGQGE